MKVSFELRKEKMNANGLIPIQFVVRAEGSRIRKNIGASVLEKYWDGSRVKPNSKRESSNNYQFINDKLQKAEERINDIFFFFRASKLEFSKELFLKKFESEKEVAKITFDFFECFKEFVEVGKLSKAYNTTKAQNTVKNFLQDFQKDRDYLIEFDSLNDHFFEELSRYCFIDKEIKNNYFAKIVAVLKTMLRWSIKKGYTDNRNFEDFKASEHDIDIIYLTFEELMKLYEYEFKTDRLNHVKDFYCMGCFTGLRFSDLSKLHLANISNEHIILSLQKTKTQNHAIKLNKYAKAILEKYKGTIYEPLPSISSQKFNDYIKECCELAEIDTLITINWFVGTKKVSKTVPKYELITSHTARKTFITNSLLLGMEPKAIKKIANIKKDAVLDKYMKVTEAFTDDQMDKAWK
ncbi:phage integrase SAM-like domain-containing protein [Chryseobacterium sp.]|uniref:site-specific integrase n=1 Tax=Chryseobacterium sp. TaxID=1871047 RepID=UPI0028991875|nr:phage integrase SAM-like domain-containing protein [Chryseobacterium sp.]